jgi:hypothetical protein
MRSAPLHARVPVICSAGWSRARDFAADPNIIPWGPDRHACPLVLFPHGVTHSHNLLLCCQVPLVGYSGEQKFREELDRQMPAHDFDATKCHDLTLEEKAEFTTLKAMKKEAHTVGVAVTVSKPIPCAKCQGVSLHWIALEHRFIRLCFRHVEGGFPTHATMRFTSSCAVA